jgi:hypothetical protein
MEWKTAYPPSQPPYGRISKSYFGPDAISSSAGLHGLCPSSHSPSSPQPTPIGPGSRPSATAYATRNTSSHMLRHPLLSSGSFASTATIACPSCAGNTQRQNHEWMGEGIFLARNISRILYIWRGVPTWPLRLMGDALPVDRRRRRFLELVVGTENTLQVALSYCTNIRKQIMDNPRRKLRIQMHGWVKEWSRGETKGSKS